MRYYSLLPDMATEVDCEDEALGWSIAKRVDRGPPILQEEWSRPLRFVSSREISSLNDAPSCSILDLYLVSDRYREFLEKECAGVHKFWEVQIFGACQGRCSQAARYWLLEWIRKYKCIHESAIEIDSSGKRKAQFPVIDHAKLPFDAVMGSITEWPEYKFIRSDIVKKLRDCGIVGPSFNKLPQVAVKKAPKHRNSRPRDSGDTTRQHKKRS